MLSGRMIERLAKNPTSVNHNVSGKTALSLQKVLFCSSGMSTIVSSFLLVRLVLVGFCNSLHLKKNKIGTKNVFVYL